MATIEEKRCLNCGTPLTDAFCPHCGQKASVARLSVKTAIIDNTWSILRMDKRVGPTVLLLATRPWVVIRDYIKGHRVAFTQPVRLIVILCFVSIMVQLFLPDQEITQTAGGAQTAAESFGTHLWHSVQGFLRESEVAQDLIDSVIFAPLVWLIYLPWGSRRFNFAEYSTAYLYLCCAGLIIDLATLPIDYINGGVSFIIQLCWWLYLLNGLVKHAFHIRKRLVRSLVIFINILLIATMGIINQYFLYGME